MRWCWAVAAAAASVGAGCSGPEVGACAACVGPRCDPPTLEIGLGLDGFAPLAEGGAFPLIHGPQGGYHLEIGLRATHLDVSSLVTGRLEGTIDGERLASASPWLDFRCEGEALESWGTRLIYESTPAALDGQTTEIVVEVTDVAGNTVGAEGSFVIEDVP
jgi:hypothetical protein